MVLHTILNNGKTWVIQLTHIYHSLCDHCMRATQSPLCVTLYDVVSLWHVLIWWAIWDITVMMEVGWRSVQGPGSRDLSTHLPLDKMAAILADDNFKCIFLNGNDRILMQISLKFVPRSPIENKKALVQVMAWRPTGDKTLSEPMLTRFSDAYMWH